ncbi:MAG: hypothetical protein ABJZ55_18560 [Fuerstiella sp.]
MSDPSSDFSKLPEEQANDLGGFGVGLLVLLFALLAFVVVYVVGEKAADFQWHHLKRGLLSFGVILLGISAFLVLSTGAIKTVRYLWPDIAENRIQRFRMKAAKRTAVAAISKKQQLSEERARLTAQLQATYLFEKETSVTANAKASQQFRSALQTSVTKSCEIAFDHISEVVQQYERVLAEIDGSSLPEKDKADLLQQLTSQLEVAATSQRNRDAQQLMESEIWKVRFRKARMLIKQNPAVAIRYLQSIRQEAKGQRLRERISELAETAQQAAEPSD